MNPSRTDLTARLALALALCLGGRAFAGELEVNPVRVDLSPRAKSAVVAIRNRAAEPARYEVKVSAWEQSPAGEMQLSPTQDVVAFPSLVQLAPGETRNLRVGTTAGFGAVEKSYRVFIEELPPPARPDEPAQVRVLSRIGIPVFLAPSKAQERAELDAPVIDAGAAKFSLRNAGNVHVRPSAVKLTATDASGAVVFEKSVDAWYVLAGGVRRYSVPVPAGNCAAVRTLRVEVTLPAGPLRADTAAPQGACGP